MTAPRLRTFSMLAVENCRNFMELNHTRNGLISSPVPRSPMYAAHKAVVPVPEKGSKTVVANSWLSNMLLTSGAE